MPTLAGSRGSSGRGSPLSVSLDSDLAHVGMLFAVEAAHV